MGPRFDLRLLELEGSKLHADWALLGFCIGNDFTDEMIPRQTLDERLVARSYTLRLARNLLRLRGVANGGENLGGSGGYATDDLVHDPDQPSFTHDEFLRLVRNRMSITNRAKRAWLDRLLSIDRARLPQDARRAIGDAPSPVVSIVVSVVVAIAIVPPVVLPPVVVPIAVTQYRSW